MFDLDKVHRIGRGEIPHRRKHAGLEIVGAGRRPSGGKTPELCRGACQHAGASAEQVQRYAQIAQRVGAAGVVVSGGQAEAGHLVLLGQMAQKLEVT